MDRSQIIGRLRSHEAELRGMGVRRLSLFGSVARGDADGDSDVDLAAELDEHRPIGLFQFAALQVHLAALLEANVDLVSEPIERPRLRARVEQDRVLVF